MGRVDRNRMEELRDRLDLRDRLGPDQTQRMLVQVYDGGSIPTTVPKVYLTHPVLIGADDTEGATPSLSADTSTTIPVVMLGPRVPVADDYLVAHAIGGRWLAGDNKGGLPATTCTPCNFPARNLTITYTDDRFGTTLFTLPPAGGSNRFTPCTFLPNTITGGNYVKFNLACAFGTLNFNQSSYTAIDSTCTGSVLFTTPWTPQLIDYTCSPFHMHFATGHVIIFID